ncbi:DUF881 domain-containing protein [Streptomyces sp. NBC_00250]|uniref:DUF881 domain-containing protein n=1 Tax=Streptomyces sp. NBC_00250 TaxID=2903641 RepID=UPI003FA794CF
MSENPQNPQNTENSENEREPGSVGKPESAGEDVSAGKDAGAGTTAESEASAETVHGGTADHDVRVPVTPAASAAPDAAPSGRRRLASAVWPPRVTRAQLIVALLLFVLGLGLAIQVSSTSDNSALRGARQEDLVRILDELDDRTQRLEDEKARLEKQRTELESSSDQAEEARKQTQEKERQLGILAGTVAAEGPGITLTVGDPTGAVESDMLLDAIQELRAAGAEAIQVNGVRVVADSYFTGSGDDMRIDGTKVAAPYVFKVIGKPEDLEPALNIPGGVVQTLEKEQATATVERSAKIIVDALRPAKRPDYAQSSSQ